MSEFPALQGLFDKIEGPSSIEIRSGKQPTHLKVFSGSKGKKRERESNVKRGGGVQHGRDVELANSISGKSPEVMVKVSSWSKGAKTPRNHMDYITRNGELEAETSTGEYLNGKRNAQAYVTSMLADSYYKGRSSEKTRVTMNMVLSMPGKGNEVGLKNAVRAFAHENFGANHEFAFVYHGDSPNDHCHLMVKTKGLDGKQLRVGRSELDSYRQSFADHLRAEGIEAAATPRFIRNSTKRAERQVVRHINNPNPEAGRAVRVADVTKKQVAEAVAELSGQKRDRPWEAAIQAKAERTTAAIFETIQDLEKGASHDQAERSRLNQLGRAGRSNGGHAESGRHADRGRVGSDAGAGRPVGAAGTASQDGADQRGPEAVEPGRRARGYDAAALTALSQSGYRRDGSIASSAPGSDLRGMRPVDVVSAGRTAALLLLPNAHNHLATGSKRDDHTVRRADSDLAAAGGRSTAAERGLSGPQPVPGSGRTAVERQASDREIAQQLRQHLQGNFPRGAAPTANEERKAWIATNHPDWVDKARVEPVRPAPEKPGPENPNRGGPKPDRAEER